MRGPCREFSHLYEEDSHKTEENLDCLHCTAARVQDILAPLRGPTMALVSSLDAKLVPLYTHRVVYKELWLPITLWSPDLAQRMRISESLALILQAACAERHTTLAGSTTEFTCRTSGYSCLGLFTVLRILTHGPAVVSLMSSSRRPSYQICSCVVLATLEHSFQGQNWRLPKISSVRLVWCYWSCPKTSTYQIL